MSHFQARTNNEQIYSVASGMRKAALLRLAEGIVITGFSLKSKNLETSLASGPPQIKSRSHPRALPCSNQRIDGLDAVHALAISGRTRGAAQAARARQRAMYLAHVAGGLSLTSVGIGFGRDRTTVRHACALWEDARDDISIDFGLSCEEASIAAMASMLGLAPVPESAPSALVPHEGARIW